MSSSTVSRAYNTESWIHMQQQQKQQQQQEGKYARSTASSRSRQTKDDIGMSQTGIYEAFAEADRKSATPVKKTPTSLDTRRKSTTTVDVLQKKTGGNNPLNQKKSNESITSTTPTKKSYVSARRQTLSGAFTSNDRNNTNSGELVKLADSFRDSLAAERRLVEQELDHKKKLNSAGGRLQQVTDLISNAKRRSSITKEKLRTLEQAPGSAIATTARRRTLSSGSALLSQHREQQQQQQKLKTASPPSSTNEPSFMRSTLADQQRRHSVASAAVTVTAVINPSPLNNTVRTSSPKRKSTRSAHSPSFISTNNHEDTAPTITNVPVIVSTLKRRSILAAATVKARQQQQQDDSTGDEKLTAQIPLTNKSTRLRKKSLISNNELLPVDLVNRRMSRTENLKDGLPTSPALAAARMARRKSVNKLDSPTSKESSTVNTATIITTTATLTNNKRTPRKRGKTLPGSLAKPPTIVQSSQLPPMKVEPIRLNIPVINSNNHNKKTSPMSVRASSSKQLFKKRMSLSTTPVAVSPESSSSSSSSTAQASTTGLKKSISTRKQKGQSHLGIPNSRRQSLKVTSATVTPSPVSGTTTASPRVRPRSTHRQSLAADASTSYKSKSSLNYSRHNNNNDEGERSSTSGNISSNSGSTFNTPIVSAVLTSQHRKSSYCSTYSNSRKNSLATPAATDDTRHRAISLKEKLEAMVAQHAIHEDEKQLYQRPPTSSSNGGSNIPDYIPRSRKSIEEYTHLLTPEERARPQRIKETLLMWDKEMVEAFSPGVPKSPSTAIKFYGHHLSPYEQNEIHSYPEVYWLGHTAAAKKVQAMPDTPALNYGYDDERGDYKSVMHDHLAYRYEVLEELGRGSFGQVVKCFDHKLGMTVAVKLIRNKKRFYAQAKTEVKILSDLVKWDPEDRHHNVKMTDSFYFRSHLCIGCECLSMNLYEFIKINNFQGFHITLIKRFTIQLLRSLSLLSKHGVVHCDLKPENILLKHPTKSTIKVIDFGSSCLENERVYTYIQSRFYRSPEIILGLEYTKAIDMWSLGCIIAELYTGVPIFPGENEQEQLACIMEVLGVPHPDIIQSSERRNLFFDRRGEPRIVCNSRGKKRRAGNKTLAQALRCHDVLFLDFIERCLEWDPVKRLTPEKAFAHEWILQSNNSNNVVSTRPPPPSQPVENGEAATCSSGSGSGSGNRELLPPPQTAVAITLE